MSPPRFLSTLSLRKATAYRVQLGSMVTISIHALLAESDGGKGHHVPIICQFLSTLSLRKATAHQGEKAQNEQISIHALLAESDRSAGPWQAECRDFYPRSPCGKRPTICNGILPTLSFLSTLSLRKATGFHKINCQLMVFLSTLSLRKATHTGVSTIFRA